MLNLLFAAAISTVPAVADLQSYRPAAGETVLRLEIEARGNVSIRLFTTQAPKTTAHIARLARSGFYNGQRFYRVVRTPRPFLIQTGDPMSKDSSKIDDPAMGTGGSGARVAHEDSGFSNVEGSVGLATQDQNDRDSGDSQFYILLSDKKFLDGKYTVFGKVVAGMDVIQRVQKGDVIVRASIQGG